jgi:hypothetical protein
MFNLGTVGAGGAGVQDSVLMQIKCNAGSGQLKTLPPAGFTAFMCSANQGSMVGLCEPVSCQITLSLESCAMVKSMLWHHGSPEMILVLIL